MNFEISVDHINKAKELATQIANLTLKDAKKLKTYKCLWNNDGTNGGIKFKNKTVLEFGTSNLNRFLAVYDQCKKWEHIWFRDNNHMGSFGFVRVCAIKANPTYDPAYCGYANSPQNGVAHVGWYFSTSLATNGEHWQHWNDGNPSGKKYTRNQVKL